MNLAYLDWGTARRGSIYYYWSGVFGTILSILFLEPFSDETVR